MDDEENVRTITSRLLGRAGFRVLTAALPSEACSIFDEHGAAIDLLLTDVVMPGMSGNEMSGILLKKRPGMPVLYMSGYTDDAIIQHGVLEAGINFLQKPFTPGALASKVREVLDAG